MKVLLVEDNRQSGELAQKSLEANGYSVCRVESAEEALEKAKEEKFGVVLMDLKMPGLGGLEGAKKLRTLLDKSVKIYALTGLEPEEILALGLPVMFDGFLSKPLEIQRLREWLKKV